MNEKNTQITISGFLGEAIAAISNEDYDRAHGLVHEANEFIIYIRDKIQYDIKE